MPWTCQPNCVPFSSYPENIPAVAETVACLGRWPELLSLLNQVGFARSDSTRNCCGDAVVEKVSILK